MLIDHQVTSFHSVPLVPILMRPMKEEWLVQTRSADYTVVGSSSDAQCKPAKHQQLRGEALCLIAPSSFFPPNPHQPTPKLQTSTVSRRPFSCTLNPDCSDGGESGRLDGGDPLAITASCPDDGGFSPLK